MIKKGFASIGQQPILAIQFCIHVVQIAVGLLILSPISGTSSPSLQEGLQSDTARTVYAIILILVGALGVYALRCYDWPRREQVMSATIFITFLLFVFFTILRISTAGATNLVWLSYFLNALIAGVVYLRLRWLAKH